MVSSVSLNENATKSAKTVKLSENPLNGLPDVESQKTDVFPAPLSVAWRLNHIVPAFIGVVLFMLGSVVYFPDYYNPEIGGWAFTVGSALFLYADLQEWWKNNRVGCCCYSQFASDFENKVGFAYGDPSSCCGMYRRAENGILFFCAAIGSALFLVGSVFFIPAVELEEDGIKTVIAASAVIFLSHGLIAYRQFFQDPTDASTRVFKWSNVLNDLPSFLRHTFASLGGAVFVVGSVFFLPDYLIDEYTLYVAVSLFVAGSGFYVLVGSCQSYRYIVSTYNYHH